MNTKTLTLSRSLIDELIFTLALPDKPFIRHIVWFLLRKIFIRMANIGATFDDILGESGLKPASEWAVRQFARTVTSEGQEYIPEKGPLIIVSNHPGTVDAVVLFSQIPREDLVCISSYIPFLDKLPNLKERLILTSKTSGSNRARTAIRATQHLRGGGSLLYFGAGHLEPDPAVQLRTDHLPALIPGPDDDFAFCVLRTGLPPCRPEWRRSESKSDEDHHLPLKSPAGRALQPFWNRHGIVRVRSLTFGPS